MGDGVEVMTMAAAAASIIAERGIHAVHMDAEQMNAIYMGLTAHIIDQVQPRVISSTDSNIMTL